MIRLELKEGKEVTGRGERRKAAFVDDAT